MEIVIIAALAILVYVVYKNLDKASPIKIAETKIEVVAADVEKAAETVVEVATETAEVVAKTATKTTKSVAKKAEDVVKTDAKKAEKVVEEVAKDVEASAKKPRAPRKPKLNVAK